MARWRCCPELTSGRRSGVQRLVWIKPLSAGWREQLDRIPRRALGWSHRFPDEGVDWAEREYARMTYPDGRIRARVVKMGKSSDAQAGSAAAGDPSGPRGSRGCVSRAGQGSRGADTPGRRRLYGAQTPGGAARGWTGLVDRECPHARRRSGASRPPIAIGWWSGRSPGCRAAGG